MLGANLQMDRREVVRGLLQSLDVETLQKLLDRIAGELDAEFAFGQHGTTGETLFRYSMALRYKGQNHTLLIPAPNTGKTAPANLAEVFRKGFEREYLLRYGHLDELSAIESVQLEVVAERILPRAPLVEGRSSKGESTQTQSYFGLLDTAITSAVVPRGSLGTGDTFEGPMVIYEEGATTVIPPGAKGKVADGGNLLIDLSGLTADGMREGS
jgi:N-methylhydantoinase A